MHTTQVAESHASDDSQAAKGIEMLVLTRKRSEMIQIGDNILIKVIRTGRSAVKIGIEAPANVRVLRAELCDEHRHPRHGVANLDAGHTGGERVAHCPD